MSLHKPPSSILVLYGSASLWTFSLGISHVVIPLYALSLGFSILKIGSIISLPVLATLGVRFVGGALSDRFGERRILQSCYLLSTLAALVLLQARGFASLLIAVAIYNMSRAFFWTPVQSLASQLPGSSAGKRLGQLSAGNAAGSLIGVALGGVLVVVADYHGTFLILTGTTLAASIMGLFLPPAEAKPKGRSVWKILVGIGNFLRYRRTWLTITASFAAGLPPALCQSIYPVYLAQLGYGEQWIGVTLSVRSLGPIVNGLLLASLITPARQKSMYAAGLASMGIFFMASGTIEQLFLLALCIAALGGAGGLMDVWYQVQATDLSTTSDRSASMASMGLGWNFAYIVAPLVVGWLAELQGVKIALLATGAFLLLIAAGTRLWFRLLAPPGPSLQEDASKTQGVSQETSGLR